MHGRGGRGEGRERATECILTGGMKKEKREKGSRVVVRAREMHVMKGPLESSELDWIRPRL